MQEFIYTTESMKALETTISAQRLQPYIVLAKDNTIDALSLYAHNATISAGFYSVLQGLEITLRNSLHDVLTKAFGRSYWYDCGFLQPEQARPLAQAKSSLCREAKTLEAGRVIAELSFGFWTRLTGPKYAELWWTHLVKAFAKRKLQRGEAHERLNTIRKFGNRIAHHESILSRSLEKDLNQNLDAIAWLCTVTSRWVRVNHSFPESFAPRTPRRVNA